MSYCLDTSIVVDIFRGNRVFAEKLEKLRENEEEVYLTSITACELFKGAFLHSSSEEKVAEVQDFISRFDIIDFDVSVCREFGKLYKKLKISGQFIPEFDLMIASLAKANNSTLITKDRKHFERTESPVQVW